VRLIFYLYLALRRLFHGRTDIYVGADQFIYWERGDPNRKIAPDAYVLFNVPSEPYRPVIRTWDEGAMPSFVVEVSSEGSRREDRVHKRQVYQDALRCPEYLIYDEDLREFLFYRLEEGLYRQQPLDETGLYYSRVLDAWFGPDPETLIRVYHADRQPVAHYDELQEEQARLAGIAARLTAEAADYQEQYEREQRLRLEEQRRADQLAEEVKRLRSELARLQGRGEGAEQ
jgi:Uma2 family endonuclease